MSFSEKAGSHLATPRSPTIIKQKHALRGRERERERHARLHPQSCLRVCLSMYKHSLFVSCLATPPHPYDVTLPAFIGR